jgi:CRISPR/Cas system-associated exonuclease Cas4 (RecB family)
MAQSKEWMSAKITSSQIATFVYCARKYSISISLPPDYADPPSVRDRKAAGLSYHRTEGRRVFLQSLKKIILLAAGILFLIGAMLIWLH